MIDGAVKDKETVVETVGGADLHSRVLPVVTLDVKPEGVGDVPGDDRGTDIVSPLGEHLQHRVVHIVVNEDDAFLCRADEVRREGVRIENLSVAEDTLHRGQCGAHEEGDFLFGVADTLLQSFKSLVDGISAKDIIFEDVIGPLTKTCSLNAFHSITNGYNYI